MRAFCGLILLSLFSTQAHAFGLLGYRWNITEASPSICWALDPSLPSNVTATAAEIEGSIALSLAQWSAVPTTYIQFTKCSLPSTLAHSNTIKVVIAESGEASFGGCNSYGAGYYCDSAQVSLLASYFNSHTSVAMQVIMHEFGHAFGLAHSDRHSVMAYHLSSDTLTNDDWAAVSYLYPRGENSGYNIVGCGGIFTVGGPPSKDIFMPLFFLALLTLIIRQWAHNPRGRGV